MSISSSIAYDHTKIMKLFYHIQALGRNETPLRAPFFNKLKKEVLILQQAEEEVLYEALDHKGKTGEIIHDLEEENKTIEQMIHTMEGQRINSNAWHKSLARLKQMMAHHIRKEESGLLPRAGAAIRKQEGEALEEALGDSKQEKWKVGVKTDSLSIKSDFFETTHAA